MKLRLVTPEQFLADIFEISISIVSDILHTWLNLLYHELRFLIKWPSREQIALNLPQSFKKFLKTRVIIDCTEYFFRSPSLLKLRVSHGVIIGTQKLSNSQLQFHQMVLLHFLSQLYSSRISDRDITERSGFMDKLTSGDDVMADRGFTIRDLLAGKGCTLNAPPFTKGKPLSKHQTTQTRRIARARMHVQRAIGRLKNFKKFWMEWCLGLSNHRLTKSQLFVQQFVIRKITLSHPDYFHTDLE